MSLPSPNFSQIVPILWSIDKVSSTTKYVLRGSATSLHDELVGSLGLELSLVTADERRLERGMIGLSSAEWTAINTVQH